MPIFNDKEFTAEGFNKPNKRGDLYIKFDISFPKQLTEAQFLAKLECIQVQL
jgi:DnaJ-class molecular chaperone